MSEVKQEQVGILVSKEQNEFLSKLSDEDCKEVERHMFELMTEGKTRTELQERNLFAEFLLLNNAEDEDKELREYIVDAGVVKHYAIHSKRKINSIFFEITKLKENDMTFCIAKVFITREDCENYMAYAEEGIKLEKEQMESVEDMVTFLQKVTELRKKYNIN